MVAELCDGCGGNNPPFEEVGFLGHRYCVVCAARAREYQDTVKNARAEAAKVFEESLAAIRATDRVTQLQRRPDQP
jgi:hypothetical protein